MTFVNKVKACFDCAGGRSKGSPAADKPGENPESSTEGQKRIDNRFQSFAPQRQDNAAKWFVDGCGYFWAVSIALEEAKESIWILDWWLSPELYLRRPPSANAQYRLDRMLFAAADRGVKVNIIVYKEVPSVLTCEPPFNRVHRFYTDYLQWTQSILRRLSSYQNTPISRCSAIQSTF